VALVDRGGKVRSLNPAAATAETVGGIVSENIVREGKLMTDESHIYD
jgi:hypothetical protein